MLIFVRKIYDFFDTCLDDNLCTFITWEESYIDRTSFDCCIRVEDRIDLCMDDIGVSIIQKVIRFSSRKLIVLTSSRKPIVTRTHNNSFIIHYASTYLSRWIFASLSRELSDTHKVLISREIIGSFHDRSGRGKRGRSN